MKDTVRDGHIVLPGRVGGSSAARRLAIVFRAAPTQDAATTVSQASTSAATPDVSQVAQTQAAAATVFEAAPTQDAAATVSRASTTTTTSRK